MGFLIVMTNQICILLKSDHMITNHGGESTHDHGHDHGHYHGHDHDHDHDVDRKTRNSTNWFRADGFHTGSLTTIERKGSRNVYYIECVLHQIEFDLAHCSFHDMENNVVLKNEAVRNGGTYKLLSSGEIIFLKEDQGMFISFNS